MFLYVSKSKIKEMRLQYENISALFPQLIQKEMEDFIKNIENAGGCETDSYNYIYEILNRQYEEVKPVIKQTREEIVGQIIDEEDDKKIKLIELLNIFRFQFATRYFFKQNNKEHSVEKVNNRDLIR